jgi:hypothetical protein
MTCNDLSYNCLTYSKIQANLQETGKQITFERGLRNDTSFPPSFRAIPDDQPQDITPFIVPKGILVPFPEREWSSTFFWTQKAESYATVLQYTE